MQLNAKPVAVYKAGSAMGEIKEGFNVWLTVVTHPAQQLNGKQVRTTAVQRVGNFGVFETQNTVYMPEERTLPAVQS